MDLEGADYFFNLFYLAIAFFTIYPPEEFRSNGLTLENIFQKFLGNENLYFIQYHVNKSCLFLVVHSLIPIVYFILHEIFFRSHFTRFNILFYFWWIMITLAVIAPVISIGFVYHWSKKGWEKHPIIQTLKKFDSSLNTIAGDINMEYRSQQKLVIKINTLSRLIATDNWILKTNLYFPNISHQSDTVLIADKTYEYPRGVDEPTEPIQIVNIQVKPIREGVPDFSIRINSMEFKTLQDRINRPIHILDSVKFHTSTVDKFIEVFREEVDKNPPFRTSGNLESCFACMVNEPNVKIHRNCLDVDDQGNPIPNDRQCGSCYCSPMWCVDCLARWFAARQDQHEKETWLQKQCSCPMCRAKFCIRDVSYIEKTN